MQTKQMELLSLKIFSDTVCALPTGDIKNIMQFNSIQCLNKKICEYEKKRSVWTSSNIWVPGNDSNI